MRSVKSVHTHEPVSWFLLKSIYSYPLTGKEFPEDLPRLWDHLRVDGKPLHKGTDGLSGVAEPESYLKMLSRCLFGSVFEKYPGLSRAERWIYAQLIRSTLHQGFLTAPVYQLMESLKAAPFILTKNRWEVIDLFFNGRTLQIGCRFHSHLSYTDLLGESDASMTEKEGKSLQLSMDTIYRFTLLPNQKSSEGIIECGIVESVLNYPKRIEKWIYRVVGDHSQRIHSRWERIKDIWVRFALFIRNLFRTEIMEPPLEASRYVDCPMRGVPFRLSMQDVRAVQDPLAARMKPDEANPRSPVLRLLDPETYEPRINEGEGLKATSRVGNNSVTFWSPISEPVSGPDPCVCGTVPPAQARTGGI